MGGFLEETDNAGVEKLLLGDDIISYPDNQTSKLSSITQELKQITGLR